MFPFITNVTKRHLQDIMNMDTDLQCIEEENKFNPTSKSGRKMVIFEEKKKKTLHPQWDLKKKKKKRKEKKTSSIWGVKKKKTLAAEKNKNTWP